MLIPVVALAPRTANQPLVWNRQTVYALRLAPAGFRVLIFVPYGLEVDIRMATLRRGTKKSRRLGRVGKKDCFVATRI